MSEQTPKQRIRVSEEEMTRLMCAATDGRTLTASYGGGSVEVCDSNGWALQLLAEWRGLVTPTNP